MSIIDYVTKTYGEMKHVVWPTRNQVIIYTALVIVVSVVVAYYLGLFDYIFKTLLELLVANV